MATYYVATNGNNSNDGSSGSPWKTPQHAAASARNLQPGDTVIVRAGTYTGGPIDIKHSGSEAGGYITFKSEVWGGAKIVTTGSNGIKAIGRAYLRIEGFDVSGSSGGGIVIDRAKTGYSQRSHHHQIVGNRSHDNVKMGIGVYTSDWVEIHDNIAYNNCQTGAVNSIVVLLMQKYGPDSTPGYRMHIHHNWIFNNGLGLASTDSGGIMVDQDAQGKQIDWVVEPYNFPRLVENNVSFHNGGSGINILAASRKRVDLNPVYSVNMDLLVRNNTFFGNGRKLGAGGWVGEISVRASDPILVNNVAVSDKSFNENTPAISIVSLGENSAQKITFSNIQWHNNIFWNYPSGGGSLVFTNNGNSVNLPVHNVNGNKLGEDPKFVDVASEDFRAGSGSPLVDGGTSAFGVPGTDFTGAARTGTPDVGAYEKAGPSTSTMAPNSLVAAAVYVRGTTADIAAAVALGGDFVQRTKRDTPAPAAWIGDTDAARRDAFAAVVKTLPADTLGAIAITFSMKPEA